MTAPLPFPVTPRRPGDPEADVARLALAHRALCDGVRLLAGAAALAEEEPLPPPRRRALAAVGRVVLREVRAHTEREDAVLWPVLAACAGAHAADLEPLVEDHTVLRELLDRAGSALAASAAGGSGQAAAVLGELAVALDEHVAEEEREVFPLLRRCVSARDLARYEAVCVRGPGLRHAAAVLPWLAGACRDDAERAGLRAVTPVPLRLLGRLTGPGWRRRTALLAGPGGH
ncbi:hemerythrin domain-containing protein [Geodermatophilus sp. FMUSA9-8]|uniref:hemerythrin domain-containing protein n=1 Tax=Geodermatophilus sp. FMUSA9-8 TaxID=3120155 RepID=UPI003008B53D